MLRRVDRSLTVLALSASVLGACAGSPGGADGGAGTGGSPNTCSTSFPTAFSYWIRSDGEAREAPYDGPAVVEQRTETEIVLALGGSAAAPDAGAAARAHILTDHTPPLQPGATVWLTKTRDKLPFQPSSMAFEVRDKQAGTPLFGGVFESPGENLGPFPVKLLDALCTSTDGCVTTTIDAIEVGGVILVNGNAVPLTLGNMEYRVSAGAVGVRLARADCQLADFYTHTEIALSYEAKNLAALLPAAP